MGEICKMKNLKLNAGDTVIVRKHGSSSNTFVKDCIVSALTRLLNEHRLSEISVKDITDRAGVSRMSYYRNYTSKESILTDHLDEIFNHYIGLIKDSGYDGSCFDYDYLLHCFSYFSNHQPFLSCLLKSGMGDLMLKHLTKFIFDSFRPAEGDIVEFYRMQAFAGSIYNTYVAWCERMDLESPEQMAQIVAAIYTRSGIAHSLNP